MPILYNYSVDTSQSIIFRAIDIHATNFVCLKQFAAHNTHEGIIYSVCYGLFAFKITFIY